MAFNVFSWMGKKLRVVRQPKKPKETEMAMFDTYLYKKALEVLMENELGGDESYIYQFSDPDGRRTGRSGYSFGRVQFDIRHNWDGIECLRDCGFKPGDLEKLFKQEEVDISDLNSKLRVRSSIVDEYDRKQVMHCIEHCMRLIHNSRVELLGKTPVFHIIDYHNQFYMSEGGKLHKFLQSSGAVDSSSILQFKLNRLRWGKIRPDDVKRRWRNVENIVNQGG
jgi:hypothetical protein